MINKPERATAIVNPVSGGGNIAKVWNQTEVALKTIYSRFDVQFTERPGQASDLARNAVDDGAQEIIAIGGDGTVNEIVNGIQSAASAKKDETVLTIVPAGTGGDFRKTFGFPTELDQILVKLRSSEIKTIDLGKITFVDHDGVQQSRFFANIASFGLSGEVDTAVNDTQWPKRLGGRFTYAWCSLVAMGKYKPKKIRLLIDDDVDTLLTVNTVAICNGGYFGGGMHIAPNAKPNDGMFDVIAIEQQPALAGIRNASKLYKGTHLEEPNVQAWTGRKIDAIPADPSQAAILDIDGEPLGTLPATFELVPNALRIRC